jgi:prophage tail gpP-like protein
MPDQLQLLIDGQAYGGWTEIRVTRGLTRCATDFDIAVTERWTNQGQPWRILPGAPCQIRIGRDVLLTGYVDAYQPTIDAAAHGVRIAGRSKTEDLIDCSPDIPSGQFAGYTLAAIAASICKLFGIEAIVQTDAALDVVDNATIERCETAWTFLERLCRLAGVLAYDDVNGNLVLTRVGDTHASGRVLEGVNLLGGHAKLTLHKRFSQYIVKGQRGLGAGHAAGPAVQNQMRAVAIDPDVLRYRPHVAIAESALSLAKLQDRADWQRNYAYGQSIEAEVRLAGWRQPDGTLWATNQLIPVTAPSFGVDQDLLVAKTQFTLDDRDGHVTTLTVGPIEGYTPDPNEVKNHKHKRANRHPSGTNWNGFGGH